MNKIKFAFFGSSKFSEYVLDELVKAGYSPALSVTDSKSPLPEISDDLDVCIVASFGKILPKEYLQIPKLGFLNVHPSLLPKYRGPSPIQAQLLDILCRGVGVTIIKMDEKMDHGPILAQEQVLIEPWPDHYAIVEEKLARAGGKLLIKTLENEIREISQDQTLATYTKLIKTEDARLDLNDPAELNLRKVFAYSASPGAYINFKRKHGDEIRVVIKSAKMTGGQFIPTRIIPAGKKEMNWQDFLRGNS